MKASVGGARGRVALGVLAVGAVAVVLAALPYKAFDLDRFFVPKELVLHAAAALAGVTLLTGARRLELTRVDVFLVAYLGLGALSAALAPNGWLATRALAVSISGVLVFWAARAVARAGRAGPLLGALAFAAVLAALGSLLQAYGVKSELVSLNRAPGGTLGNRNFVAHLAVLGTPALLLRALFARGRGGARLGALGVMIISAALVLSRSRAAWLALGVAAVVMVFAAAAGWRTWRGAGLLPRVRLLALAAVAGAACAILLPNTLEWKSDSPYLDSMRGMVNYREGSGHGRIIQYRNSVRMGLAHPVLGVGPGNWGVAYPRFASRHDPSLDEDTGMTSNPWPSSDWVAFLSERGLPAFVCLMLALVGLGVGALLAIPGTRDAETLMLPVTLVATLAALAVVGSFDAVLLLPATALVSWGLLGALAQPMRVRHTIELSGGRRALLVLATLLFGALAVARGATQVSAMELYTTATRLSAVRRAASLDPGSYRIQMRLAEDEARRGRCASVRRYAGAAHALYPAAPRPLRLLEACGH